LIGEVGNAAAFNFPLSQRRTVEMCIAFSLSFFLCLVLTPAVRTLANRVQLVDRPDGRRKLHTRDIPVAGGLAILVASGIALWVALCQAGPWQEQVRAEWPRLAGLLAACLVICAVGVADDFGRLRGRHKLLGQIAAVAVVIFSGVQVRTVHLLGGEFELGPTSVPFTAFLLLGAINSLNLLDGMDGLLSSIAFIICLALGGMAWIAGQHITACVALALAGAVLAFLCFNFPPASIFLGDSGSMLIGLTVGVLAIHSSLKAPTAIALATPVALLALPIFDTTAAIVRRTLTGRSIYTTDWGHLHHCLLRRLSHPRHVLVVTSACCLVLVASVFASLLVQNEFIALSTALMVVVLLVATRLFGYPEFLLVKMRLSRLALSFFRRRDEGCFHRMDLHLHGTRNWKILLDAVAARAFDLNLQTICLKVSAPALHEEYHASWDRFEEALEDVLWRAEIPLVTAGRIIGRLLVSGYLDPVPLEAKMAVLTEILDDFARTSETFASRGTEAVNGKGQDESLAVIAVTRSAEDTKGARGRV
jgi:UDP-GlcNAc:undecaprenyl-phosphate GlcNAc-1-phosphate transferase